MALRPCRECGRNVSTEATTCPQCGIPNPTQPAAATVAGPPPVPQAGPPPPPVSPPPPRGPGSDSVTAEIVRPAGPTFRAPPPPPAAPPPVPSAFSPPPAPVVPPRTSSSETAEPAEVQRPAAEAKAVDAPLDIPEAPRHDVVVPVARIGCVGSIFSLLMLAFALGSVALALGGAAGAGVVVAWILAGCFAWMSIGTLLRRPSAFIMSAGVCVLLLVLAVLYLAAEPNSEIGGAFLGIPALVMLHYLWTRRSELRWHVGRLPTLPFKPYQPVDAQKVDGDAQLRALAELNNHIARVGSIRHLPQGEVREIEERHGVSFSGQPRLAAAIYVLYLLHFIRDGTLSPDDRDELRELAAVLRVPAEQLMKVGRNEGERVYAEHAWAAMRHGGLTNQERAGLRDMALDLGITEKRAEQIEQKAAVQLQEAAFRAAAADQRLTPAEERELKELTDALGLPQPLGETKQKLDRYRMLHQVETGKLPTVRVPGLALEPGEISHAARDVRLKELRRFSTQYNNGVTRHETASEVRMAEIDQGKLVITSRRLIFLGDRATVSLPLWQMVAVARQGNAVDVRHSGYQPMLFEIGPDADLFLRMLKRAMADSQAEMGGGA